MKRQVLTLMMKNIARLSEVCLNCKEAGIDNDRVKLINGKIICAVCSARIGQYQIDKGKVGEQPDERVHLRQEEIYGHDRKRQ